MNRQVSLADRCQPLSAPPPMLAPDFAAEGAFYKRFTRTAGACGGYGNSISLRTRRFSHPGQSFQRGRRAGETGPKVERTPADDAGPEAITALTARTMVDRCIDRTRSSWCTPQHECCELQVEPSLRTPQAAIQPGFADQSRRDGVLAISFCLIRDRRSTAWRLRDSNSGTSRSSAWRMTAPWSLRPSSSRSFASPLLS